MKPYYEKNEKTATNTKPLCSISGCKLLLGDRQHLFASFLLVKKGEGRVREGTE